MRHEHPPFLNAFLNFLFRALLGWFVIAFVHSEIEPRSVQKANSYQFLTEEIDRRLKQVVVHLNEERWQPFLPDLEVLLPPEGDEARNPIAALRQRKRFADAMNFFLSTNRPRAEAVAVGIEQHRTQLAAAGLTMDSPVLRLGIARLTGRLFADTLRLLAGLVPAMNRAASRKQIPISLPLMNIIRPSTHVPLLTVAVLAATTTFSEAVTLLSQDFEPTTPINYTLPPNGSDPFRFQASDPARYWGPSNLGMSLNPGVTGNATTYLAAQNMNNDGDGTLFFDQGNPGQLDFLVDVAGIDPGTLTLSIDLAGMPNGEPENFLRAFTDIDGDGFYESPIFNFAGGGNSPYVDPTFGVLSGEFATFAGIPLPDPIDGILRVRLEVFNDTNSTGLGQPGEAQGVDNILIEGIPEPTTSLLVLTGLLGLLRRRREQ